MLNEITVNGRVYVDKEELRKLIREHKKKADEGTEAGFIEPDKGKRMAAVMALNHLGSVLTTKEERDAEMERIRRKQKVIFHYDKEKDEFTYFRFWCKNTPDKGKEFKALMEEIGIGEGQSVPVFSSEPGDAMRFADTDAASGCKAKIEELFPVMADNLHISVWDIPMSEAGRRLLRILHGWGSESFEDLDDDNPVNVPGNDDVKTEDGEDGKL